MMNAFRAIVYFMLQRRYRIYHKPIYKAQRRAKNRIARATRQRLRHAVR